MSALLRPPPDAAEHVQALDGLWRASELGTALVETRSTGFSALDVELPGAGWPQGTLTEILQAQPGLHEWRLLLPVLRVATAKSQAVLIGCPHLPNLPALAGRGIPAGSLLMVSSAAPADRLWAAEQALRCGEVGALLAWLPKARSDQLRRLHMASQSGSRPLVFVFRPAAAEHESSPAPLRVGVQGAGRQGLDIRLVKRRGPTLKTTLRIPAPFPAVAALRGIALPTLAPPVRVASNVVDCPRPRHAGPTPARA